MSTPSEQSAEEVPSRGFPRSAAILPVLLAGSFMLNSCAGNAGGGDIQLVPTAPLAVSHSALDELSDEEYLAHVREALRKVAEGNVWGERLLQLLDEKGILIEERKLRTQEPEPPRGSFWVAPYRPEPGSHMYFFTDEPKSLWLPRVPFGEVFLGIIVGHELQHAYDTVMWPDLWKEGTTNYVFMEMNAYRLAIELADNYTDGAFSREILRGFEEGEFKERSPYLMLPSKTLVERMDALFGPASPWEQGQRTPIYALALSYSTCQNQVERMYATYHFYLAGGMYMPPPSSAWSMSATHQGLDLAFEPGDEVTSPIEGTIAAHITDPRCAWSGLLIEGSGEDDTRIVRLLGVDATVEVGQAVNRSDPIGRVQDPAGSFQAIRPHIHLEYYKGGKRMDPATIRNEHWPDLSAANAPSWTYGRKKNEGVRLLEEAFELEQERRYAEAADCFTRALEHPWWDLTTTPLLHYLARCQAAAGDFAAAIETQKRMVELLELELAYAQGSAPDLRLGTIGACAPAEIISIQLDHQQRNLRAYEMGLDTIFVY